jgi:hypothetical protein
MLHVKARVLAQLIWGTTDATLVDAEDGRTTRSPAAWSEVAELAHTAGNIKRAKDVAAEVIGASVAWRCCERVRPNLLALFSMGAFSLEAFSREARKIISIHLTCSQAGGGLTPADARITLKNQGVGHDYAALVDAAIAASAKRSARSKARILRLRALVHSVHSDYPSRQPELEQGLGATAEMVHGALPALEADYAPQLPEEVLAMLTDEERVAATRRPTQLNPAGVVVGDAVAAAVTRALLADEPGATPAATLVRATAAVVAAAAAARSGHGTKRVASAGRRVVGGGNDRGDATPTRRPRLARPGGGGGSTDDGGSGSGCHTITAAAAAATATAADLVVVTAPVPFVAGASVVQLVAADSVDAHAADDDANNAHAAPATALPLFVVAEPSAGVVVDVVARVPDDMVAFASGLMLHAADGSLGGSSTISDDAAGLRRFFCTMAGAFDDVQLLAAQLDMSRDGDGAALAPNRALIKSSESLLALGLGSCFTSCAVIQHGCEEGTGAAAAAHCAADRAAGTTVVSVFLDPEHVDGGDGEDRRQHAFELVYGGKQRFQLRHGVVLVSRASGSPWKVVRAPGGSGGGATNKHSKKMCELRFFASHKVASICGAASEGDGAIDDAQPPCSAAATVERAVADGVASSRAEALELFARV